MKNNTVYKIISIALVIAGVIASICLAYGAMDNKVETQEKRIEKVETKSDSNENAVIRIETKLEGVIKTVDGFSIAQKVFIDEIRRDRRSYRRSRDPNK